MSDNIHELIPELFKAEYSKIIAVLCKTFGIDHFELAQDITTDTFLQASETWTSSALPANPVAWLYTVAKNKTRDHFRRQGLLERKIFPDLLRQDPKYVLDEADGPLIDLSPQNISDSQLAMIFTVCNPSLSPDAQVGLALRILCGFEIAEIADAFLTNKETINKRLYRAKEKLREEEIKIALPAPGEIKNRLQNVLATIYLLFNAGYYSSVNNNPIRKDLCVEAMRLNNMLVENQITNSPAANALLSLMCFHASRFDARIGSSGEIILYEEQDESSWDADLIAKGNYFLLKSATGDEISKYHLEASIAYWHCSKEDNNAKWESILQIYNRLLQIDYSPIAALNRTYALSKVRGNIAAITEAEKLNLSNNQLYHSLLGYLYESHNINTAKKHYEQALSIAVNLSDKKMLLKKIQRLGIV